MSVTTSLRKVLLGECQTIEKTTAIIPEARRQMSKKAQKPISFLEGIVVEVLEGKERGTSMLMSPCVST